MATSTTKIDTETGRKAFATLRFAGDNLDPGDIAAILPVKPTRAHRKGEEFFAGSRAGTLRGRTGIWFLTTERLVQSDDLTEHLRFLADLLSPPGDEHRLDQLREVLKRENAGAHITCFWHGDAREAVPRIPDWFKSAIKPLAADIETDFAPAASEAGDAPLSSSSNRR